MECGEGEGAVKCATKSSTAATSTKIAFFIYFYFFHFSFCCFTWCLSLTETDRHLHVYMESNILWSHLCSIIVIACKVVVVLKKKKKKNVRVCKTMSDSLRYLHQNRFIHSLSAPVSNCSHRLHLSLHTPFRHRLNFFYFWLSFFLSFLFFFFVFFVCAQTVQSDSLRSISMWNGYAFSSARVHVPGLYIWMKTLQNRGSSSSSFY